MKFKETLGQLNLAFKGESERRDVLVAMVSQGFFNEEKVTVYIDKENIGEEMILQDPVKVLARAWEICRQDEKTVSPENLGEIMDDAEIKIYAPKEVL